MLGSDRSPPSATPELKLATAALAEARDQVIEASRLKSEFLAMMTHEIRTPLAGIIGMADLLLETPLVGEQRDFASIIRRQADSLLDTLNDILDFSRLEAGRLQLEDGEIEVAALLVEMDWHLPELDGFAATRAIRLAEAGTGQRIPIVAMTANATSRDRESCFAAGMDDYLSKPVTRAELRRVLDRWVRRPATIP